MKPYRLEIRYTVPGVPDGWMFVKSFKTIEAAEEMKEQMESVASEFEELRVECSHTTETEAR